MNEYNPYETWIRKHINHLGDITPLFKAERPVVSGWDTETTGLHIIKDKPFLIIFGWLIPGESYGRVYTFYPTDENMKVFLDLASQTRFFVGHNFTYDLSMIKNIGYEYKGDNMVENMVVARLSLEALSPREGGDRLALTVLGTRYIHPLAAHSEKLVKEQLRNLKQDGVNALTVALAQFDHPTETVAKYYRLDTGKPTTKPYAKNNPDNVEWRTTPRKWNKGLVEDFLKDITNDVTNLPEDVKEVWEIWKAEYPSPTYNHIDRELMIKYAGEDVITMLEFFKKAIKIVIDRKQGNILKRESQLIPIILDMERAGLQTDQKYLEESRLRIKSYIVKKRQEMYQIAGAIVNVGQGKTIVGVFRTNWNINLTNCDKGVLTKIRDNEDYPSEARQYAKLISDLRRLEKWYSTYITRIQERSNYDGRLYMQLNQAGAVSGRFSSDGQQFPKDAIHDDEGNELFHPRRAFVADKDKLWYFLDYSQVELRNQANYTLLVSGGDMNLCRSYIPFKCEGSYRGVTGEFNYSDPKKRKYWQLKDFWHTEDGELWTPTDVHGQTARNALLELGYKEVSKYKVYTYEGRNQEGFFGNIKTTADFKKVRNKGKTFNFMRNYGGGLGAAMSQLNLPKEVAQALIDGYTSAFPEVITYQNTVQEQHWKQGYVTNMYGRRYYLDNMSKSYVLANYLIQGTCADMIKDAMIKIYAYLQETKCETKMIMTVHDEIMFSSVTGEEYIINKCKEIMEDHDWHYIPIVADKEVTSTTWVDKKEVA